VGDWVKPIGMMEHDFRRQGVFLLVDVSGKKLRFYGFKKDHVDLNRMIDSMKGRCDEMVKFLIERARVPRGETT
jgi:hypothetical protein